MPVPLRLDTFAPDGATDGPKLMAADDIADLKLIAYEDGYNSGWDDAQAQNAAQDRLQAETVARAIEGLHFTIEEARGHMLRSIEPVLRALAEAVLPVAARHALAPMVLAELMALAERAGATPVTLHIPTGTAARFEAALAGQVLPPLSMIEDPGLAPDAARLTHGATQTDIDLSALCARTAQAIDRFYQLDLEERRHG